MAQVHAKRPRLRGKNASWVAPDAQPFNQDARATKARHLIVVACHSVVISGNLEEAGTDENVWFLLDYQKGRGLPHAIVAHIKAGIEEANKDPDSLLIFSGGETRSIAGPLTEGSSYFRVADAMELWPEGSTVRARTITEEFATDSFENLLFSLCRFKEVTGSYPTKITIVSFTFKQHRFENLHTPALQFPSANVRYIGVDPSPSTGFDLQASTKGEDENAARPFESDPYGCHTPVLQEKRRSRNPFSRTPPYELSCPDMRALLNHCGPELFPRDKVPWNHLWLAP